MAVVLAGSRAAGPPAQRWRWPRRWLDQQSLLEQQHDGLEALLAELLQVHGSEQPPWSASEAIAYERVCRRLLWDLRLHLRLEERWLQGAGCLCPGHRAAHGQALAQAQVDLQRTVADRQARLAWLQELQLWFSAHRHGPDATAYSAARSSSFNTARP